MGCCVASLPYIKSPESLKAIGRADLAQQLQSASDDHWQLSLSVGLISLGMHSDSIENALTVTKSSDNEVSYFYSDQEEIVNQYQAIMLDGGGIPEDKVEFVGDCFEDRGEYGRAIIGAVSAS